MSDRSFSDRIDSLFPAELSPTGKDLKLNLKRFTSSKLAAADSALVTVALAAVAGHGPLLAVARDAALAEGLGAEAIKEAVEAGAMMTMLNLYYRFRHMSDHDREPGSVDRYGPAGLRMNAMANPVLGKQLYEQIAFAVSVVNGCERCINAHEQELLRHGLSHEVLHDLARLAATVSALAAHERGAKLASDLM